MASQLFLLPFRPALDANALPVTGARLFFYASGTSTPQPVYSDEALTTPLSNPVTADAVGAWPSIYLDQTLTYRVVVKDADGNTLPNGEADPYVPGVVDGLAPEIASNAAASAASAALSELSFNLAINAAAGINYATTADGLADTVDGETFGVLDQAAGRAYQYQNDGGAAVLLYELATFGALEAPSGAAIGYSPATSYAAQTLGASLNNRGAVVTDYEADATGSANSAPAFTSALAAFSAVRVPQGTFKLDSSVTVGGSRSWRNEGAFTGAGALTTSTDFSGFNYSADFRKVRFVEGRGSVASPVTDKDAVGVFSKHSNVTGIASAQNPAVVGQHYKWSTTALTVAQAGFFESIDKAGNGAGRTDFVEGARAHGIGMGASAYGVVALGQVGDGVSTPAAKYAVGVEGEVIRTAGVDAVDPLTWTSANNLDAMFLATARIGVKPMTAYLVNPFSEVASRCGYMVGNSFAATGATTPIVDFAAFCTIEASVPYGLYARGVNFAVVSGPNNVALLRALNNAGTNEDNLFSYGTDDTIAIGTDADGVRLKGLTIFNPPASATPGSNGELVLQATSNTSLTFKYKGSDGTIRSGSVALA